MQATAMHPLDNHNNSGTNNDYRSPDNYYRSPDNYYRSPDNYYRSTNYGQASKSVPTVQLQRWLEPGNSLW
jgi:hypothetical protein